MSCSETAITKKAKYNHLPPETAALLKSWCYKGARTTEYKVGPIMPTIAFNTVDLKLPTEGPAKILEINGLNSGLSGLETEQEVNPRAFFAQLLGSFGISRARFRYQLDGSGYQEIGDQHHPYEDGLAAQAGKEAPDMQVYDSSRQNGFTEFESKMVADALLKLRAKARKHPSLFKRPTQVPNIQSISEAAALVELNDNSYDLFPQLDDPDILVVNPAEIRLLEDNKVEFARFCRNMRIEEFRPRSSIIRGDNPSYMGDKDLRLRHDIDDVVLKTSRGSSGTGVMRLSMEELKVLSSLAQRLGGWAVMAHRLSGKGFVKYAQELAYQIDANYSLTKEMVVEEYVPSKVIEDEKNNKYDATMRIVTVAIADQEKVNVVPLGGYWKLPARKSPNTQGVYQGVSNVYDGGTLPVEDEDFKRAFDDTARFMKQVMRYARSSAPEVNYWPIRPAWNEAVTVVNEFDVALFTVTLKLDNSNIENNLSPEVFYLLD